MRRAALPAGLAGALAVVAVLLATGGDDGPGRGAHGSLSARHAITRFVAALNARDGAAACRQLAPEVARSIGDGHYGGPVGTRRRGNGCAAVLTDVIEKPADAADFEDDDEVVLWSRATIRSLHLEHAGPRHALARLRIAHRFVSQDTSAPATRRLRRDRIWLEHRDGLWVITGVGAVYREAIGQRGSYQPPWIGERPFARADARRAVTLPGPPRDCARDVRSVRRYPLAASTALPPELRPRRVEVRRLDSGGICVAVTLAGPPRAGTRIDLSARYYEGHVKLRGAPSPRRPPGTRYLRYASASIRFDPDGRSHRHHRRNLSGPPGPAAAARRQLRGVRLSGGRGATLEFFLPRLRDERIYGRIQRFDFGVRVDSVRGSDPDRLRNAAAFPCRHLLLDGPQPRPGPSTCTRDVAGD